MSNINDDYSFYIKSTESITCNAVNLQYHNNVVSLQYITEENFKQILHHILENIFKINDISKILFKINLKIKKFDELIFDDIDYEFYKMIYIIDNFH